MLFERLDGSALFETEPHGFNKDQVGQHLLKLHQKYEKLRWRSLCLLAVCVVFGVMLLLWCLFGK